MPLVILPRQRQELAGGGHSTYVKIIAVGFFLAVPTEPTDHVRSSLNFKHNDAPSQMSKWVINGSQNASLNHLIGDSA